MITLEQIQEAQSRTNRMIDESVAKGALWTAEHIIPGASLKLASGERYAGIILNEDGKPHYHLILLPGDSNRASWADQKAWAGSIGGELPTLREQSLLFANLCGRFEACSYWSAEASEGDSRYAWYQCFGHGRQCSSYKSAELRAVAVRRVFV